MPVPVFTTGEVLTAANMNAVGLWKISTTTINSSGNTDLTNIFSTNYDVYQLVFSNLTITTAATQVFLRMLSGTTPLTTSVYNNQRLAVQGSGVTGVGTAGVAVGNGIVGFVRNGVETGGTMTIMNPFLAKNTAIATDLVYENGYIEKNNTLVGNSVSYDGLRIYPSSANTLTGTVRVYGYRN